MPLARTACEVILRPAVKLRLYHHPDGARIAYREAGAGPPLALLHSKGLTHREWEPVVDELAHRHRVVLPDLPLHGASEDRPRHPYSPEWLTELLAGFLAETCGPRPLVAGHGLGAQLALRAVVADAIQPAKLILLPNPMHAMPTAQHARAHGPRRASRCGRRAGLRPRARARRPARPAPEPRRAADRHRRARRGDLSATR